MTTNEAQLEDRVAALISALADAAPIDVDPMAMSRMAAAADRHPIASRFGFMPGRLAFALLLLALASVIAGGALVAGRFLERDAEDLLTERPFVEPFVGLPPEGAAPSTPDTGTLVVGFMGRVDSLGSDVHEMWLLADGRLIWQRNLDTRTHTSVFGTSEPTTAVIEQRLTSEGVELIRKEVAAVIRPSGGNEASQTIGWDRPGVLWGSMTVGDGSRWLDVSWSDPNLPGRLAEPASWLPDSAWADRRLGGYVASRYAVCAGGYAGTRNGPPDVDASAIVALLPDRARGLLGNAERTAGPWLDATEGGCYIVSTDDARVIGRSLDEAGLERIDDGSYSAYAGSLPAYAIDTPESIRRLGWNQGHVSFAEVLPHGQIVCYCG